jgi:hypothetical protein
MKIQQNTYKELTIIGGIIFHIPSQIYPRFVNNYGRPTASKFGELVI